MICTAMPSRAIGASFLVLGLVLAMAGTARADDPAQADLDRAEALYTEGELHFKVAEYEQAIAAFKQAYKLSRQPLLLYNLAQVYRAQRQCRTALSFYRSYLRESPDAHNRAIAETHIAEMERCDRAARPEPPKPEDLTRPPVLPVANVAPSNSDLAPRRRRTKRLIGMISAGAGLALVGTGGFFSFRAADKATQLEEACRSGCDFGQPAIAALDRDGRAADRNAVILYAVGGTAIVAGVALYLWDRGEGTPESTVGLLPGAGGAVVTWSGSY